jgi:hypothetical protein
MSASKKQKNGAAAATVSKQPHPISAHVAPTPNRELTDFQMIILDLAGDMILNGTNLDDLKELLHAVAQHVWRRRFPNTEGFSDECKYAERIAEEWPLRLTRHWPEEIEEPTGPPPKTLSEMMRRALRDELQDYFRSFLATARMHELYLLKEVLEDAETRAGMSESEEVESRLAAAFMYQIDNNVTYIKVPAARIKLVEEYVALLDRAEHPDAA